MDFATLPHWALPLEGESRASWLQATGALLPLLPWQWSDMVASDPAEPEQPLRDAAPWTNLPDALGELKRVPSLWRLAPKQRDVYCIRCHIRQGKCCRWPTRVPWLDARRVVCDRHPGLFLEYTCPSTPRTAAAVRVRCCDPEVRRWLGWLDDWIAMRVHETESLWRRDLALLCARNWLPGANYFSAAYAMNAILHKLGAPAPPCRWHQGPLKPIRLGLLPPAARLASLFAAFRYDRLFAGDVGAAPPPVGAGGWRWLARRWRNRGPASRQPFMAYLWQRHGMDSAVRSRGALD